MKNIVFTIAFLWGGLWALAQSQQQPVMLPITSKEGLPSDNVYATFQDSKGLIWFATERGLVRYDGKKLKVYTQADGLTDREVLGVAEDKKGRIWVTCFNRFAVIKDGEKFVSLEQHPHLAEMFKRPSSIGINHIMDIGTGIWFANRSKNIYFYNNAI